MKKTEKKPLRQKKERNH